MKLIGTLLASVSIAAPPAAGMLATYTLTGEQVQACEDGGGCLVVSRNTLKTELDAAREAARRQAMETMQKACSLRPA